MPRRGDSDGDDDDDTQSMSSLLDRLKSVLDDDISGASVSARELQRMIEDGTFEKSLPKSLGDGSLRDVEEMLKQVKQLAKQVKKGEKDGTKWKRCMERFIQFWERLAVIAALPVPDGDLLIRIEFEWFDKNFIEQQEQNGWRIREALRSIVLFGERDPDLLLASLDKNETGQIKRFLEMVAESEEDFAHLKDTWSDARGLQGSVTEGDDESNNLYGLNAKTNDLTAFLRLLELLAFLVVNEPTKKDQLELRDRYRARVNCMDEPLQRAGCQLLLPTFDLLCRKTDPASIDTSQMSALDTSLVSVSVSSFLSPSLVFLFTRPVHGARKEVFSDRCDDTQVKWLIQMVESGEMSTKQASKKFKWNLQSLKLVAGELVVDTQAEELQKLGSKQFVQSRKFWKRVAKICMFPHLAPFGREKHCGGGIKTEKKKMVRDLAGTSSASLSESLTFSSLSLSRVTSRRCLYVCVCVCLCVCCADYVSLSVSRSCVCQHAAAALRKCVLRCRVGGFDHSDWRCLANRLGKTWVEHLSKHDALLGRRTPARVLPRGCRQGRVGDASSLLGHHRAASHREPGRYLQRLRHLAVARGVSNQRHNLCQVPCQHRPVRCWRNVQRADAGAHKLSP
eukprot:3759231-Rhodomonas_salina.1